MKVVHVVLLVGAVLAFVSLVDATTCSGGRTYDPSSGYCLCNGKPSVRGSCKVAKTTSKCDSSHNSVFNGVDCHCLTGTFPNDKGLCVSCTAKTAAANPAACGKPPVCPSGHKDAGSGKCTCNPLIPLESRTAKDTCKCTLGETTGGCGDPHFIGGNGVRFDFHGVPEKNFCLISDTSFQLNAHFIGQDGLETGMDGTWMDRLGFVFVSNTKQHTLTVDLVSDEDFANQVPDIFLVSYDSTPVIVNLPMSGKNVWTSDDGVVTISRGSDVNKLTLTLKGHFQTTLTATAHEFPNGHHIDFDVDVMNITDFAHGILGQTFQPARMHLLAGSSDKKMDQLDVVEGSDHDYIVSDLTATDCKFSRFVVPTLLSLTRRLMGGARLEEAVFPHSLACTTDAGYVSCMI